jgi:hypothetical protein
MRKELLKANLVFLHGTMLASEELLRRAIAKSDGALREYFEKHLLEETGHVEMLETDLANLGVTEIIRCPEAAKLAGAQYYYIEHEHPALLLGYMGAMENPLSLDYVDALEAMYGPLTCLRHHAFHDIGHSREIAEMIDGLGDIKMRVFEHKKWVEQELQTVIWPCVHQLAERLVA